MAELEEKLESILGNPQAMAQIMSLAQSLSGGGSAPQPQQDSGSQPQQDSGSQPQDSPQAASPRAGETPSLDLSAMLGGLDPGMLSAAASLIGKLNDGGDDRRTALLSALRPFVREERWAKLDKAIQIAKLSRLIRAGLDLLRQRREGEDAHV